jgi:NIPSNAP protein
MIFERRRYTLRPGKYDEFIRLQHERGFGGPFAAVMERLIGYFIGVTGPTEQIVHLYRYDDFEDWIDRLHGLYGIAEMEPYFVGARAVLSEQDIAFFRPAPIAELTPLWNDAADWLPGTGGAKWNLAEFPELIVEEQTVALRPGGLIGYWDAMNASGVAATEPLRRNMLASWFALTGRLHVAVSYHVFCSMAERDSSHAEAAKLPAMAEFTAAIGELVVSRSSRLLRPVAVPEMSPLFVVNP